MRRRPRRFAVGPCEVRAASTTDLGFLLLTFFVVTTAFAIEQGLPLVLPGRADAISRVDPAGTLEIRAEADGSVEALGVRVQPDDVQQLVSARLARDPDLAVVLATAPDASYGTMLRVLNQIELANCRRISVRSLE
jgi:biopolymer transport protein ExbD